MPDTRSQSNADDDVEEAMNVAALAYRLDKMEESFTTFMQQMQTMMQDC